MKLIVSTKHDKAVWVGEGFPENLYLRPTEWAAVGETVTFYYPDDYPIENLQPLIDSGVLQIGD
jgi:hypothetical protein